MNIAQNSNCCKFIFLRGPFCTWKWDGYESHDRAAEPKKPSLIQCFRQNIDRREGHSEPIVTGVLIDAKKKSVGKSGVVILCKAACDWLIIKMN